MRKLPDVRHQLDAREREHYGYQSVADIVRYVKQRGAGLAEHGKYLGVGHPQIAVKSYEDDVAYYKQHFLYFERYCVQKSIYPEVLSVCNRAGHSEERHPDEEDDRKLLGPGERVLEHVPGDDLREEQYRDGNEQDRGNVLIQVDHEMLPVEFFLFHCTLPFK